jgi:hypothetical protein
MFAWRDRRELRLFAASKSGDHLVEAIQKRSHSVAEWMLWVLCRSFVIFISWQRFISRCCKWPLVLKASHLGVFVRNRSFYKHIFN